MSHEKKTLTTGEAAEFCDVNIQTIIRWIDRGLLKAYKLPGRGDSRIKVGDFVDFLESNQMPVPVELKRYNNRILIVDDDVNTSKAIQRVLKSRNFQTCLAESGFKAGAMLNLFSPTLVTLDLKMPGMGGKEVISTIRTTKKFARIKILVISAMPLEQLEEAIQFGADDFLVKPFQNERLIEKVNWLLEK
jgi:excisionase family DNA binding protein